MRNVIIAMGLASSLMLAGCQSDQHEASTGPAVQRTQAGDVDTAGANMTEDAGNGGSLNSTDMNAGTGADANTGSSSDEGTSSDMQMERASETAESDTATTNDQEAGTVYTP